MRDNSNHTLASKIVEKRNGIGSDTNGTAAFGATTYGEARSRSIRAVARAHPTRDCDRASFMRERVYFDGAQRWSKCTTLS